jgi:hypothetical protein
MSGWIVPNSLTIRDLLAETFIKPLLDEKQRRQKKSLLIGGNKATQGSLIEKRITLFL